MGRVMLHTHLFTKIYHLALPHTIDFLDLQQREIFLKQNPEEAHLITEELQQMEANYSAGVFLFKISRYLGNKVDQMLIGTKRKKI